MVSRDAKNCPHCGHRLKPIDWPKYATIGFAILVVGALLYSEYSGGEGSGHACSDGPHDVPKAIAEAPIGKVGGIAVLELRNIHTISSEDKLVRCEADAVLNNAQERHILFRYEQRDDNWWVYTEFAPANE
jgi:hypothetical protein